MAIAVFIINMYLWLSLTAASAEHLEKREYDKMITHYLKVGMANDAGIPGSKVEFLYRTLDKKPGHTEKLLTQAYNPGLNFAK